MKGEIYMFKKVVNGSIVSIASLVAMLILSVALVSAKANTIKTYYKFACSTTSKEHSADFTGITFRAEISTVYSLSRVPFAAFSELTETETSPLDIRYEYISLNFSFSSLTR